MRTNLSSKRRCKRKHEAEQLQGKTALLPVGSSKQHYLSVSHLLGKEGGNSCPVASRLIPPYPHRFTVTEMCLLQKYVILTCANHWVTSFIIDHLLSVNWSVAADAF